MTKINRLTQIPSLDDSDLSVVWQDSSGRTRAITIANLRKFIQSTDPNADAFVKAELVDDELILTSHDETETRIDINILPEHSVTELNDMPSDLISGHYLKVADNGREFVLTPASEVSTTMILQADGVDVGEANVLNYLNSTIVIENGIAEIRAVVNFANTVTSSLEATEQEFLSVDHNTPAVTIDEIDNFVLTKIESPESEGVNPKIKKAVVGELASGFSLCPDSTPADTQILQISSGTYSLDSLTFAVGAAVHDPVYVGSDGKLTLDESDYVVGWVLTDGVLIDIDMYNASVKANNKNPVVKTLSIDSFGSGNKNLQSVISQDDQLHTVIDATREFRVNYKDIGTGATVSVMGIDNNQAQFLVPIYVGNDKIALVKDIPNKDNFILKHTNAELNKLFCAYQGKYNDNRVFYPTGLYQDVNGWTQSEFTGNMIFKAKNKDTGTVGDKVLELRPGKVVSHKETELLSDTTYEGDTSQPKNPITREALNAEPQKEWFTVANGTLTTNGNRPTGGSGTEGELAVWHNVTSESTTDPANELKVLFDGAYDKVDSFSKPLRFKLSQQSGERNQYWTVGDNGWQTDGNVWHLSAIKVTGDNLVVGIDTKIYASAYFLDEGGGSSYHGEGLGVPEGAFLVTGTVNQSEPVGLYYNGLNDGSSLGNIELNNDDGYNEFHVIIQGLAKATRDWRIGTGTPGRYSDKTIRTGETWLCRVFVDWNASSNTNFFWTRLDDGTASYVEEEEFNAKSGYNRLYSGGGSTHTITYSENGSILKISNPTVKVQLLQGMSDENPHGYIKYINSRNSDVQFEWYDRNGNQVTNNVPSVCPANTVVEIFADYSKDEYVLNFGQSKVINSINEEDQLMEGLAQGFIYAKSVSVG